MSPEELAKIKADAVKELEQSGELKKIQDQAKQSAADALSPEELAKIKADAVKELEQSGELKKIQDEAKKSVAKDGEKKD